MIDECNLDRAPIYSKILNNLSDVLKSKLDWKNNINTEKIFKEMLPYNQFSEVRDILSNLIKSADNFNQSCIEAISEYPDLIDICPLSVRQHIWEYKKSYLVEKVNIVLDSILTKIPCGLEMVSSTYDSVYFLFNI